MSYDDNSDDTRELIKKILNKKDPAIVGLKKILHGKRIDNPERSFTSHVPEVFNTTSSNAEEATQAESLFNESEKQIIEHEQEILELKNQISDLENSIEELKAQAFEEGLAEGASRTEQEMLEKYQQQIVEINENYNTQLAEVVTGQLSDRENQFKELEPLVIKLSLSIAKKIIDEAISVDKDILFATVKKALAHIAGRTEITLRVAKDETEIIQNKVQELTDSDDSILSIRVEGSPMVSSGGCLVETETGIIDATIENQLLELEGAIGQFWQEFKQSDTESESSPDAPTDQLY